MPLIQVHVRVGGGEVKGEYGGIWGEEEGNADNHFIFNDALFVSKAIWKHVDHTRLNAFCETKRSFSQEKSLASVVKKSIKLWPTEKRDFSYIF